MRRITGEQCLMRIFIGESDRYKHRPLYEALANLFRTNGFAGVTVLRGVAGFGAHSIYHTDKLLELSTDLPFIIEVVESRERIDALMPEIDAMMNGGMVTLEPVEVVRYYHCHEGVCT
jgi:PII-like signaling protein